MLALVLLVVLELLQSDAVVVRHYLLATRDGELLLKAGLAVFELLGRYHVSLLLNLKLLIALAKHVLCGLFETGLVFFRSFLRI